ncbi:OmpA family protein [Spirulina subsalsa FACHB-351]|uniref:OmpA family protein n=1 Tax=Spirulina subsalsa FACHB-351 TaxID=234711 RepID=A0ABT3LAP2_9CYAN|nr:OmpA family protein [Spirulina subsalsa]MCW6038581.1 OmpA family protein [Spirulina subsalsa FACHB-351]
MAVMPLPQENPVSSSHQDSESPSNPTVDSPQTPESLEGLFSLLDDLDLMEKPAPVSPPPTPKPPQKNRTKAPPPPKNSLSSSKQKTKTRKIISPLPPPDQPKTNGRGNTEDSTSVSPAPKTPLESAPSPEGQPLSEGRGNTEDSTSVSAAPKTPLESAPSPEGQPLSEEAVEQLRALFLDLLLGDNNYPANELEAKVAQLEQELHSPNTLNRLLSPGFLQLFASQVNQAPQEVVQALFPIIDLVIGAKSHQDTQAMSKALASAIPGAFSKQLGDAPDEIIQAIAPAMGRAIKEQIRLEKDAMVDALYPVIGNTVSKYMEEVVSQINQRVESAFSLQGIYRKIRAKMQGVSDAELILSESLPFTVQAVFLIHKTSGLVIAEVQQEGNDTTLEADMLAGMLTAIRSFASECTVHPENTSELTEIDYENFKIILEVAGYCYIAAVTQGDPPPAFHTKLQQTLSAIILNYGYGNLIEEFNGNPDSIPRAVYDLLKAILNSPLELEPEKPTSSKPRGVLIIFLLLLLLISVPLSLYRARQHKIQQQITTVLNALSTTPELALYRLDATIEKNQLILTGKLPNSYLQEKAAVVAGSIVPDLQIDNQILAVQVPPDPTHIEAEVRRHTSVLNRIGGVYIIAVYDPIDNKVSVEGSIRQASAENIVTEAFIQIPGVTQVIFRLSDRLLPVKERIYFDPNATNISQNDRDNKLIPLVDFLQRYPYIKIRLIGHTDASGDEQYNRTLAPRRAEVVKDALIAQGIQAERLETKGDIGSPPDVAATDPFWKSRCVRFELIGLIETNE